MSSRRNPQCPRIQAHLPCRPPAALAEPLGEGLLEDHSHIRPSQILLVHRSRHAALQGTMRAPPDRDSHGAEEDPPQDGHTTHHLEEQSVPPSHAGYDAGDVERGKAAYDPHTRQLIRELPGTNRRVRASTGDPQHREPLQPESRCQLDNVVGPVHQGAAPLIVRQAHARSVERNQPDPSRRRRIVGETSLEARPRPAVEIQERTAAGIAPFRIAQATPVSKSDGPVGTVPHRTEFMALPRSGPQSRIRVRTPGGSCQRGTPQAQGNDQERGVDGVDEPRGCGQAAAGGLGTGGLVA